MAHYNDELTDDLDKHIAINQREAWMNWFLATAPYGMPRTREQAEAWYEEWFGNSPLEKRFKNNEEQETTTN
jgi:hypothetical protein